MIAADLAVWLLADDGPIATDERWARDALTKGDWNGAMGLHDYREPVGQHIARWNPARVLAECAAKRKIAEARAQAVGAEQRAERSGSREDRAEFAAEVDAYDLALLALAQPYAGRPGWLHEWRTT